MSDLYPVTITQARYQGVYEGGKWLAFHADPADVPAEAFADDITCSAWWGEYGEDVGTGDTPGGAHRALLAIAHPRRFREPA